MGSHHSIHLHHVSEQAERKKTHYVSTYTPVLIALGLITILFSAYSFLNFDSPDESVGNNTPIFSLPPVEGEVSGLNSNDFLGQYSLVSVFASWCEECQENHNFLLKLSTEQGLPVYGLNYKDRPEDARLWLDRHGNPFTKIGADLNGEVASKWGVYGLPEIFLLNNKGQVVYRHMGSMDIDRFNQDVLPLITKYGKQDEHIYPPEYR
ncbi:redoxin family protein [Terasakiella pusilla]|uniref:redoxin family protein n=1 Tax=Terasakiella pusilla TaxID=64973 RepID=UPI000690424B|nr:redoxin family protein [Terasakiella pusilla]